MATQENSRFTLKAFRRDGPPRKFTLELSLGGLVTLGVAVIIGLVWVFIFGIIVGRGYRPEQAVPEIARIMPDASRAPLAGEPPRVLQPEELNFHDALRVDQPAAIPVETAPVSRAPAQQPRSQPPATVAPAQEPPPASAVKAPRQQWTYQAASFKAKEQADNLIRTVQSQGLNASLEQALVNGVPYYRVMVLVRGTEADNQAAVETLTSLGLSKPLLRKRDTL